MSGWMDGWLLPASSHLAAPTHPMDFSSTEGCSIYIHIHRVVGVSG